METLLLAIKLAEAIAQAVPVVMGDAKKVASDSDLASKTHDAIQTAKDALDALDAAIKS